MAYHPEDIRPIKHISYQSTATKTLRNKHEKKRKHKWTQKDASSRYQDHLNHCGPPAPLCTLFFFTPKKSKILGKHFSSNVATQNNFTCTKEMREDANINHLEERCNFWLLWAHQCGNVKCRATKTLKKSRRRKKGVKIYLSHSPDILRL